MANPYPIHVARSCHRSSVAGRMSPVAAAVQRANSRLSDAEDFDQNCVGEPADTPRGRADDQMWYGFISQRMNTYSTHSVIAIRSGTLVYAKNW